MKIIMFLRGKLILKPKSSSIKGKYDFKVTNFEEQIQRRHHSKNQALFSWKLQ